MRRHPGKADVYYAYVYARRLPHVSRGHVARHRDARTRYNATWRGPHLNKRTSVVSQIARLCLYPDRYNPALRVFLLQLVFELKKYQRDILSTSLGFRIFFFFRLVNISGCSIRGFTQIMPTITKTAERNRSSRRSSRVKFSSFSATWRQTSSSSPEDTPVFYFIRITENNKSNVESEPG